MQSIIHKLSLALVAVLLFSNTALATNIAVFNFMEITQSSAVAKTGDKELKDRFGKEEEALQKEMQAFQKKGMDFQKQAAALSEKSRNEQLQKLMQEERTLQEKQASLAQKVGPRQQAMRQELAEILKEACETYAKAKKLDILIESAAAPYVATASNVTKDIIKEMDAIWKKRGSKFKN